MIKGRLPAFVSCLFVLSFLLASSRGARTATIQAGMEISTGAATAIVLPEAATANDQNGTITNAQRDWAAVSAAQSRPFSIDSLGVPDAPQELIDSMRLTTLTTATHFFRGRRAG